MAAKRPPTTLKATALKATALPLRQIGVMAGRVLVPGMRGRLLGVTDTRLVIQDDRGGIALVAAAADGFEPGPLMALVGEAPGGSWYWLRLAAGERVYEAGGAIRIAEELALVLETAKAWQIGPLPPVAGLDATVRAALAAGIAERAPEGSPIQALRPLLDGVHPLRVGAAWSPWVAGWRDWLVEGTGFPDDALADPIGRGEGLTPPADDWVAGLLFALARSEKGGEGRADRLAAFALPLVAERSGPVAEAALLAARDGEGPASLARLWDALGEAPEAEADGTGPRPQIFAEQGPGKIPWAMLGGMLLGLLVRRSA